MDLNPPRQFTEAIQRIATKKIFPTNLSSAELSQLGRDVTANSFFSARNMLTGYLDEAKAQVLSLADGKTDIASARLAIKETRDAMNYRPSPEDRGTIKDLTSTGRINLVLTTNTQMAQAYAYDRQGQTEAILDQWPAYELVREEDRKVERDWIDRFRTAGEATGDSIGTGWTITPDGRMIALKNHDIWDKLGDPALFDDALGNDYEPYAFGSGMGREDVDRDEAMSLGLIDRDTQIEPDIQRFEMGGAE